MVSENVQKFCGMWILNSYNEQPTGKNAQHKIFLNVIYRRMLARSYNKIINDYADY